MLAKLFISIVRISPFFQKNLWKWWYQRLGNRGHDSGWTFMNYGYLSSDFKNRELSPDDEKDRMFINLYDFVASQIPINGLSVLEVGSGRGGGASFVARYHNPKSIVGLDFSRTAISLSTKLHRDIKNLSFKNGDAEKIPFADNSFDVILNVESSHCYGNMANFIAEVYRVLKPNGKFSWADLRASEAVKETEDIFNKSKLKIIKSETITDEVIKALDSIHDKKIEMINSYVPKIINNAFKDFAGVKDSKIYNSFKNGNAVYLSKVLQKVS